MINMKMFCIMFTKMLVIMVISLILYEKLSYIHLYFKLKGAQNTLFQSSMISNVLFFFINSLSWQKMVKNQVSHAKVQANMTWVTTMCTFSPCAGSFDLFVRLFRKLSYRIIYWCVFSASSHHSESNEMR